MRARASSDLWLVNLGVHALELDALETRKLNRRQEFRSPSCSPIDLPRYHLLEPAPCSSGKVTSLAH